MNVHYFPNAPRNSTNIDGKKGLNVHYKVRDFGILENQDDRPGLLLTETISTFSLQPLKSMHRNLTGSKILMSSLPNSCFSDRSKHHSGRSGLRLAETFSTSLQPLKRIQRNLTESKISMSSAKFVIFGTIIDQHIPFQIEALRCTIVTLCAFCNKIGSKGKSHIALNPSRRRLTCGAKWTFCRTGPKNL